MELNILNLLLVLLAAWLGGQLAVRLGYPAVLGELLVGILLGPPLLGLLHVTSGVSVLAQLGVLLMMLYIGLEIDLHGLGKASGGGLLAAIGGFAVPFGLGYWVMAESGAGPVAGTFVGMAMGVTSLATKSRILVDLKILDTRIAHVMMAGALITDTISLIIFAGLISFATAGLLELDKVGIISLKVILFFAVAWVLGLKAFPPLYAWLKRKGLTGRTFNATLVLLIALGFAELAHLAELHAILGAFIAGLLLRRAIAERKLSHELTGLVKDVSLGFLAPIFFVTAGFQVSFEVFQTDLGLLLTLIVLATVGKIVGTALFYLPTGYGWREGLTVGAGMNGRGAVEIVIAEIGLQAGIIDRKIFSILVFMAIMTTATVPVFLKLGIEWLRRRGELVRSAAGKEGVVVVGAGPVAQALAGELAASRPVTLIDINEENCRTARAAGLKAVHGDALDAATLRDAGIAEAGMVVGLTRNAEVNVLAVRQAHDEFLVPELHALLASEENHGLYKQLRQIGAHPLFVWSVDLEEWDQRLKEGSARVVRRVTEGGGRAAASRDALPLAVLRGNTCLLFAAVDGIKPGDVLVTLETETVRHVSEHEA